MSLATEKLNVALADVIREKSRDRVRRAYEQGFDAGREQADADGYRRGYHAGYRARRRAGGPPSDAAVRRLIDRAQTERERREAVATPA